MRQLGYVRVAYEVCTAFHRANILAVLVGGGAATFYAPEAYESRDLDFVLHLELFGVPNGSIIESLGFVPSNTAGTYKHPDIPYTLEILQGPLAIGDQVLTTWETSRTGDLLLHIISSTDCVKDRLAHGIHFRDINAVRQAAQVAKCQSIDLEEVRSWCESEGGLSTYRQFEVLLGVD